jgi:hypothetical protein
VTFAEGKMQWIEVVPAGSSTSLALTRPMDGGPTAVDTGIILSTTGIEADHATLEAAGVDVDAGIARSGDPVPPMFRLCDPGGNSLTIVEPTEWACPPGAVRPRPASRFKIRFWPRP